MYSWELASTLKEAISKFEAAGVKLIAIGIGEPKKARIFAERVSISSLIFLFFFSQFEMMLLISQSCPILKLADSLRNHFMMAAATISVG